MRLHTIRNRAILACAAACFSMLVPSAIAVNLTDLDPSSALFVGDEDSLSTTAGGAGNNGLLLGGATNTANGFTFNVTFTPDVADLSGLVLLMEIGGTTNGLGLYLIDGVPALALKTGAANISPATESNSDLDFSDGAASIFSSYGPVTSGNSISVAATWGTSNVYSLAVQDDTEQYSTLDALNVTGQSDAAYNWIGNGTFNVADDLEPNPGSRGGLTDNVTNIWLRDNMVDLTADLAADSAIYWNDRATLTVDFGPPPPPPIPTLTVNRDTGNITLDNMAESDVTLIGYTIQTSNGAFDTSEWDLVDDLDADDTWEQLTAPGNPSTDLSEATLGAGYTMDATGGENDSIDFGDVWVQSPFENVTAEFRDETGEVVSFNLVFEGNGGESFAFGDFDFQNGVDSADWAILRSNLISDPSEEGLLAYKMGDINVDGLIDETDFDEFKVAFDTANGAGALAAMIAGVPEPGAMALVGLVGLVAGLRRTRTAFGVLLVALFCGVGMNSTFAQTNLFSDSFGRATTPQVDDIDVTTTGMGGALAPLALVENGDVLAASETITNLENDMLHVADGPNASAFYIDHNFTDAAITSDGVLSISLDVVSNDGSDTDTERFVGFGLGATQAEFTGQSRLDFETSATEPALRGNLGIADSGFADLWVGWSPNGGGTIQVVKNGSLVQAIDDGVTNAVDSEGDIQPGATLGTPVTLELRMEVSSFDAGVPVPATIYYDGVAVGGDAIRWDNTDANYIGVAARQSGEGFTVDSLAIVTTTDAIEVQTMSLEVDPSTGEVFVVGGAGDVAIDRYKISSPGDGLIQSGFDGIGGDSGLPAGDGSGNGWELGGVQTDSLLSEFYLGADGQGASTIGSAFKASLGVIYDTTADTRDLMVEYRLTDGTVISGSAVYQVTSVGLPGDFNSDGSVDAADYTVWRDSLDGGTALPNDNGLGTPIGSAHYDLWRSNYGASSSPEAGAASAAPEPTAAVLLCLVLMYLATPRRLVNVKING